MTPSEPRCCIISVLWVTQLELSDPEIYATLRFNLRFSEPFLKLCLQLAGFEDIREVPCPPVSARWGEIYSTFKAFLAFRTKSKTSALSGGKAIRDLPGDVRKSTLFLKRLVRSVT